MTIYACLITCKLAMFQEQSYKNIEDHEGQITPLILYERPHTYYWSIMAFLVKTNRKTGRKDLNKLISRPLLIFY